MQMKRFTVQTRLANFIPLPRPLLEMELNSTQILLYGLLLDRATLSQKNDYCDTGGWVYVVYPEEELSRILCVSTRIVRKYTAALEAAGLLRKVRHSRKQANQLYLYIPADCVTGTVTGRKDPVDRKNTSIRTGKIVLPSKQKEQTDFIDLYRHGEEESL